LFISASLFSQKEFTVYFPIDESYMMHKSKLELLKFLDSKNVDSIVKITGYTDTTGINNYNLKLAEKRIKNIHFFLIKNRAKLSKNLNTVAMGENFEQDSVLAKNRKVKIEYTLKNSFTTLKPGEKMALKNLNFVGGEDTFLQSAYTSLNELLHYMIENEVVHIKIHGHICCNPDDYSNLSERRAIKVYEFLIKNNITPKRMTYKGHGSTVPIHPLPEINEIQRQTNRRVEIEIRNKED
jgi:outer membrane protein OmpA-like peptidoglycan-associated protein